MRHRRLQTAARLTIALIALIGQSAVLSIAAGADDLGAAAHVEQSGVALHHAHNEATCIVCRALSLHGRTQSPAEPGIAIAAAPAVRPNSIAYRPEQATLPSNPSRAPPEIA